MASVEDELENVFGEGKTQILPYAIRGEGDERDWSSGRGSSFENVELGKGCPGALVAFF